uniref:Reverse transcriptase domain-containing protein n=1 Tax=Cyprinus carpio TaxID=7962 RepID=A0A8C2EK04_CYPCA
MKVLNDIIGSVDQGDYCASLFIDLSKAFDTVDHEILLHRLRSVGLSKHVIFWFKNYLINRTQCVQAEGINSGLLEIVKGVPQGSVLGPLLFTIYINSIDHGNQDVNLHFYADDTVMYCGAPSKQQALIKLQAAFDVFQSRLHTLKLVLNADKTKIMLFSSSKKAVDNFIPLQTLQGNVIELVKEYKYLGITIDDKLSFGSHITNLTKQLKIKLGFYFRNKFCFSFNVRKRLVSATFLPVLDYGDVVYQYASSQLLSSLDAVYHSALRFISDSKPLTHHCILYNRVSWPSLSIRRKIHFYLIIYKTILGLLPSYLGCLIQKKSVGKYSLRSDNCFTLSVPFVRTELGKRAFMYAAPFEWNSIQTKLKLQTLLPMEHFKSITRSLEEDSLICNCF